MNRTTRPSKERDRTFRIRFFLLSLALFTTFVPDGATVELWSSEEGEGKILLDATLKGSSLGAYLPGDQLLFPKRWSGAALSRLRLDFNADITPWINAQLSYEHRSSLVTTGSQGGGGVLPSFAEAPFRLEQLDWQVDSRDNFTYRHEIDRAFIALHPDWGEVTIGRQAIGLGRGVLFSAVDVFSPFSTVEVDREWRRGVDAFRLEYRIGQASSVEFLAVLGDSRDDSAFLGRFRGIFGDVDLEFLAGKRAEDTMIAGIVSASVGDAEMHLELALFNTPESQINGGLFGKDDLVLKAVVGGSYTFNVGSGLTIFGEYHYSGFGVKDLSDAVSRLFFDPAFQKRLLRGDMQILGRHALAFQLGYRVIDTMTMGLLLLQSPVDGSGLAAPSLIWDYSENASLRASLFVPWGASPRRGRLESEYGGTPISLFVQWTRYF